MKKLIFVMLMFGFLAVNAQQVRQQSGLNNTGEAVQLYSGINPGYASEVDQYSNHISKPDFNPGFPVSSYQYMTAERKTEFHPGFPVTKYKYMNKNRRTDNNAGHQSASYKYMNKDRIKD